MNAENRRSKHKWVWCGGVHGDWYLAAEHVQVRRAVSIKGLMNNGGHYVFTPDNAKVLKAVEVNACDSSIITSNNFWYPWVWACGECGEEYHWEQATDNGSGLVFRSNPRQRKESDAINDARRCCQDKIQP